VLEQIADLLKNQLTLAKEKNLAVKVGNDNWRDPKHIFVLIP